MSLESEPTVDVEAEVRRVTQLLIERDRPGVPADVVEQIVRACFVSNRKAQGLKTSVSMLAERSAAEQLRVLRSIECHRPIEAHPPLGPRV